MLPPSHTRARVTALDLRYRHRHHRHRAAACTLHSPVVGGVACCAHYRAHGTHAHTVAANYRDLLDTGVDVHAGIAQCGGDYSHGLPKGAISLVGTIAQFADPLVFWCVRVVRSASHGRVCTVVCS